MSINVKDLDYKRFIGMYNEKFENRFNNFIGSVDKDTTDEQIINGLNKIYGDIEGGRELFGNATVKSDGSIAIDALIKRFSVAYNILV